MRAPELFLSATLKWYIVIFRHGPLVHVRWLLVSRVVALESGVESTAGIVVGAGASKAIASVAATLGASKKLHVLHCYFYNGALSFRAIPASLRESPFDGNLLSFLTVLLDDFGKPTEGNTVDETGFLPFVTIHYIGAVIGNAELAKALAVLRLLDFRIPHQSTDEDHPI